MSAMMERAQIADIRIGRYGEYLDLRKSDNKLENFA